MKTYSEYIEDSRQENFLYSEYIANSINNKNKENMSSFNPRKDKLFVKTDDKIIDAIIKFTIYNPYFAVILTSITILIPTIIINILYTSVLMLIPFIIYMIIIFYMFFITDFADKFFIKIPFHTGYYSDKKTYFQHQYEYTENLNKQNKIK